MISSFLTTLYGAVLGSFVFINTMFHVAVDKYNAPPQQTRQLENKITEEEKLSFSTTSIKKEETLPVLEKDKEIVKKETKDEKEKATSTITTISSTDIPKQAETIPQPSNEKQIDTIILSDQEPYIGNPQKVITNPCKEPIFYTLGDFDTRFDISKKTFLEILNQSASLWNNAAGRNVFIYDDQNFPSSLRINLVYDERQEKTNDNKLAGTEINNTKDAAGSLKKEYETMKESFNQKKESYTQKVEAFNTRQKTYNETVAEWNKKGGAPHNEYTELMNEKAWLLQESDSIQNNQDELTSLLTEINLKITKYNTLISYANKKVEVTNKTSSKKFTEGLYNPNTKIITIYQWNDMVKLERVLTHELGHALGIGHLSLKKSIMYPVNGATSTTLSTEDINALETICTK